MDTTMINPNPLADQKTLEAIRDEFGYALMSLQRTKKETRFT
jgi:hypothetical protein